MLHRVALVGLMIALSGGLLFPSVSAEEAVCPDKIFGVDGTHEDFGPDNIEVDLLSSTPTASVVLPIPHASGEETYPSSRVWFSTCYNGSTNQSASLICAVEAMSEAAILTPSTIEPLLEELARCAGP